ncbi:MbnP family protein [Roseibacillus persicicus]|uniref:MbnP family protein n=1 Tax=Roseibacillus persicicus TaxID=454148 RepID=UPI00398AC3B7
MKTIVHHLAFTCCLLLQAWGQSVQCDLVFELDWRGERYQVGAEREGRRISRCDYLLSQFALQKEDGSWMEADSSLIALISHGEARNRFSLGTIPEGRFQALRFVVGLDENTNASDPNRYPPEHPLNPQLNNLHWTWQSGYIFCALEGHSEQDLGFLYHLGNDSNATEIVLPLELDLEGAQTLSLSLDLAKILASLRLDIRETTSTHSRPGDPVATTFSQLLGQAFAIDAITPGIYHSPQANNPLHPNQQPTAEPAIQRHFPQPDFPADNPLTHEGVALGKALFFDPILSKERNLSCASCHQPEAAFSDAGMAFSEGHLGGKSTRNSMPLFNLVWHREMFWDGRVQTLREQVLHPIEHPDELALPLTEALQRLNATPEYPTTFAKVFGKAEIDGDLLAKALEQYLLSLISQESRFDQAMRGEVELTAEEKRGFELFITEHDPDNGLRGADCFHCHGGALFSNHTFANNGLDPTFSDLGRAAATGLESDRGKFKVPSLRNLTLTAPYMHDGRFATLEEVVEHYNSGVQRSPTLDPNLAKHPETGLHLTEADKAALVAFLTTLTEHRFPN